MTKVKMPSVMLHLVLDELYNLPLAKSETIDDRCKSIEAFMAQAGWTWDDIIQELVLEDC